MKNRIFGAPRRTRFCILLSAAALTASAAAADEVTSSAILTAFDRGGEVMWAILLASIIGCAYVIERCISLRRSAQIPKTLMDDLRDAMVKGGVAAGRRVVAGKKSAMARVMHALLSRSGATRRELEGVLDDEATRVLFDLRHNLRPIGVIASIAPLLGLLGTVFGLIAAFRTAAELGMDDPRNFAAGIYEALYTTAFGLVVAIPLLVIYHMLRNRSDSLMRGVEERALAFIAAASIRAENARTGQPHEPDSGEEGTRQVLKGDKAEEKMEADADGALADSGDTSVEQEV